MSEIVTMQSSVASDEDKHILELALSIEDGWDFRTGDPEIFTHRDMLVVPGGKALDLGIGGARTSLFFAMHGMEVQGYDIGVEATDIINSVAAAYDLPLHGDTADITRIGYGQSQYDMAVLSQTFVHFPSTGAAYGVIEKAAEALKPGGHMYIRAVGIHDNEFVEAEERWTEPSEEDPRVYYEACGCSGEWRIEPHLFFDPIELMAFLETHGMQLVYSQVAPQRGSFNVMYAEDWHIRADPNQMREMITLIARKHSSEPERQG